eukprot:1559976-Rhodomonas_salina.1
MTSSHLKILLALLYGWIVPMALERQSSTATRWVACSDALLHSNLERAFTWQELYNNISTTLAADLR